jgi:hypothetical protein
VEVRTSWRPFEAFEASRLLLKSAWNTRGLRFRGRTSVEIEFDSPPGLRLFWHQFGSGSWGSDGPELTGGLHL